MAEIARWTTPTIFYKPCAVTIENISEIFLTIKQPGGIEIVKDISAAETSEDSFMWTLTQEDSSKLSSKHSAVIQVDYKTVDDLRYTTVPRNFTIGESGINEVI